MEHETGVVIIGIAGGTASGKSTIARAILDEVGEENISHILHDSYYFNEFEGFPRTPDGALNFDHPDSLDTELLIEHLQQLHTWQAVNVPIYDFVSYVRSEKTRPVAARPVIIVEGILVFTNPHLRDLFDIKIFVDTPADLRFIRRLNRDITERGRTTESVINQYIETVRPMHQAFVEPSKIHADIIIPQGGFNTVAISLMSDKIRSVITRIGYGKTGWTLPIMNGDGTTQTD